MEITTPISTTTTLSATSPLFAQLFSLSSVPMVLVNPELSIQAPNAAFCRLFGYHPNEFNRTISFLELLHSDERQRVRGYYQQNLLGVVHSLPFNPYLKCLHKSGSRIDCELVMDMIPDRNFTLFSLLKINQRQTNTNSAATLQSPTFKILNQISSNLAHEIKNPLHAIIINMEILRGQAHRYAGEHYAQMGKCLDTLSSEVVRLDGVVRRLLEFTQPLTNNFKTIITQDFFSRLLELVYPQIHKSNTQLIVRMASDLPNMVADESQLQQIFLNLLLNAVQAIEQADATGGKIIVRGKKLRSGNCLFSVTDSGVGMSKEEQSKLFNLYFSTKEKGRGLGLAMVLRLVENHGGFIRLRSAKGRGSHVSIVLPNVLSATSRHGEAI